MSPPLVCPGPVEQWFPLTVPAGNRVWQAARCYEHTETIVGAGIIIVFGLLAVLILALWARDVRRAAGGE